MATPPLPDLRDVGLQTARIASGLIKKIPQPAFGRIVAGEADVVALTSDAATFNSFADRYGFPHASQAELDDTLSFAASQIERASRCGCGILTPWDPEYPALLLETPVYPRLLYRQGNCDLNKGRFAAVVGTRSCTAYGVKFTADAVSAMAKVPELVTVVSGLALGIDAAAHTAALKEGLPTVAVLAGGLDSPVYPSQHAALARDLVAAGGCLLSEYPFGERPYRQRFLERNRIVAGMSHATLVCESAVKGGAMSTASTAHSFGRTVLALPGRIGDTQSQGCNLLVSQQKAQIVCSPGDVLRLAGLGKVPTTAHPELPLFADELEGTAKEVYDLLKRTQEPIQLDELSLRFGMRVQAMSALLADMEFDGYVSKLPGNRFTII